MTVKEVVAYGVTSQTNAKKTETKYFVTTIDDEGKQITLLDQPFKSWQDATKDAKEKAEKDSVPYWIADQTKAFQKRIAKANA